MKKDLLRLLKEDKLREQTRLRSAIRILERYPLDSFWLGRKRAAENKIKKIDGYVSRLDKLFEATP